ncbi:MAG: hypothetical protein GX187_05380 [Clostridiaceae bacterium]|nr:hypothetical protein [Clostridiaceae bacterium]
MQYVRRLPLLLALMSGILTGLAGHSQRIPNNENIFRMCIVMFVFYIAGFLMRNTIMSIIKENRRKAAEIEREKKLAEIEKQKGDSDTNNDMPDTKGLKLDFTVGDNVGIDINDQNLEDVANFIRNELNQ